jgi:hypothetical protein
MRSYALAIGLLLATPDFGNAQASPPPPPATTIVRSSASAGPWVIGLVGASAVSVILRSIVVGHTHKRDLTPDQAQSAIFLPFLWLFVNDDKLFRYKANPAFELPDWIITVTTKSTIGSATKGAGSTTEVVGSRTVKLSRPPKSGPNRAIRDQ